MGIGRVAGVVLLAFGREWRGYLIAVAFSLAESSRWWRRCQQLGEIDLVPTSDF
ncbi:hypothetical protein MMUC44124_16780 [Mycolicibacterium mucogenicum DSM 44124]|nr:hypothetical protein MMUC44124_16780 [Mycolicibacterium mucogenicum DSM 44124]